MAEETAPQVPSVEAIEEETTPLVIPDSNDLIRLGLLGLGVGLLIPLLSWLLQSFLVNPVFCREASTLSVCSAGDLTTYYISTVVMGVIAVSLMANWQVFRPLLIVLATISSLWGLQHFAAGTVRHAGWEYYVSSGIMYGLAFLLFYWLLRLRSFAISVILTVLAIVLVRWALLA